MTFDEDDDALEQEQTVDASSAGDGSSGGGSANKSKSPATSDMNKISPIGTWEYMAPECWKRKYGSPHFKSDIFAFGVMLWEMLAGGSRVYEAFDSIDPELHYVTDKK
jgi:serine/threonine protein kinase